MSLDVKSIDNKFKTKKHKDIKRQAEFDGMERHPSQKAKEKFKAEPYQLQYQRKVKERYE
jgi:hypothetical protein